MPSERFRRLPEKKKAAIREAVIQEFARVPFEKASINKIIQAADISRGSFYTYFEGKEDVVCWLFEDSADQMTEICSEVLNRTGGDYFAMLEAVFEYMVDCMQDAREMLLVARNVFENQENTKFVGFNLMPKMSDCVQNDGMLWKIYDKVDKSQLRVKEFRDFFPLFSIGGLAVFFSMKQYYDHPEELSHIREMFHDSLDVLRYGALKNGA